MSVDGPAGLRVLHATKRYGEVSQPFVVDAVLETSRLGCEPWILSKLAPVAPADGQDPTAGRRLRPVAPSPTRRALGRALRRDARARTAEWWRPAVRRARPDVLHAHFGWTAAEVSLTRLAVPTLVSFHGSDVNAWPGKDPANRAAYDDLFAELDRATVVSRFVESRLRALGYRGRTEIVPAGVRLDEFPFSVPGPTGDPALRLAFVGRQVACKGLDVLLRALPAVIAELPDRAVRLVVVGDGEERAANEALCAELGLRRVVEFRGATSRSGVVAALRGAEILVVPSRVTATGEAEGSPVAPKEALAMGVEVVATDVGGLAETVVPSRIGELVEPEAPGALARRIVSVASSPDRPARAAEGRAWVEAQFDWRILAGRLVGVYEELALSSPAGTGSTIRSSRPS